MDRIAKYLAWWLLLVTLMGTPVLAQTAIAPIGQVATYSLWTQYGRLPDIAVTTASQDVSFGTLRGSVAAVFNIGTNWAYVKTTTVSSSLTAPAGIPIGPGACEYVNVIGQSHIQAITALSTTTLQISIGIGSLGPCGGGSGGAGGANSVVFGPTPVGSPAANPPILVGGTVDGTATGTMSPWKVLSGVGFINCANCSGSGASAVDLSTFTPGSPTVFAPSGGFFQTVPTNNALTNLQTGTWQLTAQRAGFVNLRTATGAEIGTPASPLQVSLANTGANGTAVLVTGAGGTFPVTGTFFQATQPVSGTITANQGGAPWSYNATQLNGVNLGSPSAYGTSPGAVNVPGVNAFITNPVAVTGTFWQATQPVSGTVTANAGTNLNTSALALETGGNLANIYTTIGTGPTPSANTVQARLATINTTLGTPFQAGGSIGNTSFGISGTLPAFAATPTVNIGTIGGIATAANQATNSATTAHTCSIAGYSMLGCLGQIDDDTKAPTPAGTAIIGKVGIDQTTPGVTNGVIMSGSTGTNNSINPLAIPSDVNFVTLTTIAVNSARASVGVQNQSNATIQLVRDDGAGANQTSIFVPGPFGNWSSSTFKGRLTIYGLAGSAVAAYQD